ncbi:MAG: response regulator transcription factor [Verrucomicrobia bacterium]|nr:response regulator transcription factor [Verrucomicrobiota bacterium]
MKIRTVIVDDEPLARERLRKLLTAEADIELVAECGDGAEAVEVIDREQPDLVFLDIQMPELDGFGVVQQMAPQRTPEIVFVTAFNQHALKAFEVHALDYLLKPFDRDRFQLCLNRARTRLQHARSGELNQKLTALIAEMRPPEPKASDRLAIKTGGKVVFVKTTDIDWIEAADNYVNLHIGPESHLLRETMSAIEARLDPKHFLRVSRSAIVNVDRIKELQPMFHGDYTIILRNGTKLGLSRNYREKLQQLLGK